MLFYPFRFKFISGTLSNAKSENKDVLENDPAVYDYPSSPGTSSSFQAKKSRADELVDKVEKLESNVEYLITNADELVDKVEKLESKVEDLIKNADESVEKVIKLESKVDDLIKNADVLYKEFIIKFMYFLLFLSVFFFILDVIFYNNE